MSRKDPSDTRTRILEIARDLFGRKGCQNTSIREIADQLSLTKTAVLYHFSTKANILAALALPLLDSMEGALDTAAQSQPAERRRAVVEGLLDAYLAHRHILSLVIQNLAVFVQEPAYRRFFDIMLRANRLVAGTGRDLAGRVRAVQAISMLSDPVILFADTQTSAEALRREILAGVRLLLKADGASETPVEPPVSTGPAHPRRKGRPSAMTPVMVAQARQMQESGRHTAAEIAQALGVSRATLFRHV